MSIVDAVMKGDGDQVSKMLNRGENPNTRDRFGSTLLCLAVHNDDFFMTSLLLSALAEPDIRDKFGELPLHTAVKHGNHDMMRLLLNSRANVKIKSNRGMTAVCIAADRRDHVAVEILARAGADVNACDDERKSPLHIAAQTGCIHVISALINHGANPNVYDDSNVSPLQIVVDQNFIDAIPVLINGGADITSPSRENIGGGVSGMYSILSSAINERRLACVCALVDGAPKTKLDKHDRDGNTPLTLACSNRDPDICKILLAAGASPNQRTLNVGSHTPLRVAISFKSNAVIEVLLKGGADPNFMAAGHPHPLVLTTDFVAVLMLLDAGANPNGAPDQTKPLYVAATDKREDTILALLQAGANPNLRGSLASPLWSAVFNNLIGAVKTLLEVGADPNAKHGVHCFCLHLASTKGHSECVRMLLDAGANVNALEGDGTTALHVVSQTIDTFIISRMLLEAGADPNIRSRIVGDTPLKRLIHVQNIELVACFLQYGANLNIKSHTENTVFHTFCAIGNHKEDILVLLLMHGANPYLTNNEGKTPYAYALKRNPKTAHLVAQFPFALQGMCMYTLKFKDLFY